MQSSDWWKHYNFWAILPWQYFIHHLHIWRAFYLTNMKYFQAVFPQKEHKTWRPLVKSRKKAVPVPPPHPFSYVMGETQRGEAILRNLAQQLLSKSEYQHLKYPVKNFQQTKSVPTLCHQLRLTLTGMWYILLHTNLVDKEKFVSCNIV